MSGNLVSAIEAADLIAGSFAKGGDTGFRRDLENQIDLSAFTNTLRNVGLIHIHAHNTPAGFGNQLGNMHVAETFTKRSHSLARAIGSKYQTAMGLRNLSFVHIERQMPEDAILAAERARDLFLELERPSCASSSVKSIALAHACIRDEKLCEVAIEETLELMDPEDDPFARAVTQMNLGEAKLVFLKRSSATPLFENALHTFTCMKSAHFGRITQSLLHGVKQ